MLLVIVRACGLVEGGAGRVNVVFGEVTTDQNLQLNLNEQRFTHVVLCGINDRSHRATMRKLNACIHIDTG